MSPAYHFHEKKSLPTPCVRVVVTTYKRPETLARLLDSLIPAEPGLREVLIVDNAADSATRVIAERAKIPTRLLVPGSNLSCGGGAKYGMQIALADPETTHCWLFDDDAKAQPGALAAMLTAMRETDAETAVPLVLNEAGTISWPPGLLEKKPWRCVFKERLTPSEYIARCGSKPVLFSWCPWPTMLVSRRAVETVGFPRDDFWLCSEDLEFSLRITRRFRGIFVPTATCAHLPPTAKNPARAHEQNYLKFCSMLQNNSFLTTRLPHTRHILRHLPGNYLRFLRTFGVNTHTLVDIGRAFWWGAVRGRTAGMKGFDHFRERYYAPSVKA
jgi:GT2 family glycosyltransferase